MFQYILSFVVTLFHLFCLQRYLSGLKSLYFLFRKIFLNTTIKIYIDLHKQWAGNSSILVTLKGIFPCISSLGCRFLCKESFLYDEETIQDMWTPINVWKAFFSEIVALLPYLKIRLIIRKRQKQLNYFSDSLPTPVSLHFKCILSTVHDHLESINNYFRTQMPSHWEFPNWVTLQSAAQNHTRSPGGLRTLLWKLTRMPRLPTGRCAASGNIHSALPPISHLQAFFIDLGKHMAGICLWITICQSVKHVLNVLLIGISAKQNTGCTFWQNCFLSQVIKQLHRCYYEEDQYLDFTKSRNSPL